MAQASRGHPGGNACRLDAADAIRVPRRRPRLSTRHLGNWAASIGPHSSCGLTSLVTTHATTAPPTAGRGSDDAEEAIAHRLDTYEARPGSVREALESWADVIVIDGDQRPDDVTRAILHRVERRMRPAQAGYVG